MFKLAILAALALALWAMIPALIGKMAVGIYRLFRRLRH